MTIKDQIQALKDELANLGSSYPEIADRHNFSASALYRFSKGGNLKIETIYRIDAIVQAEAESISKQRS